MLPNQLGKLTTMEFNVAYLCVARFNETVATIIPLVVPLSKDVAPVVKQHLVEQLKSLAEVISRCFLVRLLNL